MGVVDDAFHSLYNSPGSCLMVIVHPGYFSHDDRKLWTPVIFLFGNTFMFWDFTHRPTAGTEKSFLGLTTGFSYPGQGIYCVKHQGQSSGGGALSQQIMVSWWRELVWNSLLRSTRVKGMDPPSSRSHFPGTCVWSLRAISIPESELLLVWKKEQEMLNFVHLPSVELWF